MSRPGDDDDVLDLDEFNSIMNEYASTFENAPNNATQIAEFCKSQKHNYKYGQVRKFYSIWKNTQDSCNNNTAGSLSNGNNDDDNVCIDWEALWEEYENTYKYRPKKGLHLWNFAKEQKSMSVKYKEARNAFTRISKEKLAQTSSMEGQTTQSTELTDSVVLQNDNNCKKAVLSMKMNRYTAKEDVQEIKEKYVSFLGLFRKKYLHDPVTPLQLFNFINDDTEFKVRYGDMKKCFNLAQKCKWFTPMKRAKKNTKNKKKKKKVNISFINDNEPGSSASQSSSSSASEEEGVEYVLVVDHEKLIAEKEKADCEEKKKEIVVLDEMNQDAFLRILDEYNKHFENPATAAVQIKRFAQNELKEFYKYKACRIAFNRYQKMQTK